MTRIGYQESETIEFKESFSELDAGGETIVGFANKGGGDLYFGVKNNGDLIGMLSVADSTLIQIAQKLSDNIEPQLVININKEVVGSKEIVHIKVSQSSTPYHTYKGKPYIRIANTTREMKQSEYTKRLIQYGTSNKDYSSQTLEEAKMTDLSEDAIQEVRKLLTQSGRYDVKIASLSDEQLLKDLLLIRDGKFTVAALILLGSQEGVAKHLPYSEVRYGYKSDESEVRNQDTAIFKEGYFLFYNKIWEKIQARNITLSIPLGMRLIEKKAFDELSIREAINNAIAHRDYQSSGSTIIMQYQKRIVIKSPGGFPEGVTVENILEETRPRNKLLADMLFKCELVEQFGNGVNLMFRNQLSLGKNPPSFNRSTATSVELELDGSIQDEEFAKYVLRVANEKDKILNDAELIVLSKIKSGIAVEDNGVLMGLLQLSLIEKTGYSTYMLSKSYYIDTNQESTYTRTKGFTWTRQKELILEHLKHFGKGTKKDFAGIFEYKLPSEHISNLITDLKRKGRIEYIGKPKSSNGYWTLVRQK